MPGDEETELVAPKPKRAPRKRAPKPVAENGEGAPAPVKGTPRKRAPRKVAAPAPITPEPEPMIEAAPVKKTRTPRRKAPTPLAAEAATKRSSRRQLIVVGIMMLVGIASSAAVGLTDEGRIDINAIIAARNERIATGELHESVIPIQNTSQVPDGGLIPLGDAAAPQVSGVASSTGSSTDATSTETTASSTGNVPVPPEEISQPVVEEAPAEPAPQ